jgi:hypothetical protein
MADLPNPLYILVKSQGKEETDMEAIREHGMDVGRVMHWEGIDFELLEPEIKFERPAIRSDRGKRKQHLTAKQKKLVDAERYTHTLP